MYGDVGTSPLYPEQAIFSSYKAAAQITPATQYGIASEIFWALMVVVSIKYAGFIMRAHNRGDGGIMALTVLPQRNKFVHGALLWPTVGLRARLIATGGKPPLTARLRGSEVRGPRRYGIRAADRVRRWLEHRR